MTAPACAPSPMIVVLAGLTAIAVAMGIRRSTAVDLDQNIHSNPVYFYVIIFLAWALSWAQNNRDDIVRSAGIGGIHILL